MNPVRTRRSKRVADAPKPKESPPRLDSLVLRPRLSEKAYALSEASNTYIFDVASGYNKFDVARAVTSQYEVTVKTVRLASVPGKIVRVYRQRGRKSLSGKRSNVRKAYVTLKEGDKLPIFAAIEETKAPEENK